MKRPARKLNPDEIGMLIALAAVLFGCMIYLYPPSIARFPINDGGLFYAMIRAIQQNAYRLPEFVQEQLEKTKAALARNNGLTLILALSYGGRTEIVEAIRAIASKVRDGDIEPAEIDEPTISQHLYTHKWPDPDLLIRTSGEQRLSNFLLWQTSYAEFVVTPTLWPDFRKQQLFDALEEYTRRHRRFGGL